MENNYPNTVNGFHFYGQIWEHDGTWRQLFRNANIEFLTDPGSEFSDLYLRREDFTAAFPIIRQFYTEQDGRYTKNASLAHCFAMKFMRIML